MINLLLLALLALVVAPSLAYANPIVFSPLEVTGKLFLIFLIEPVIVFTAVGWRKVRIFKFGFWWIVITFSTFILLIFIISIIERITASNMIGSIVGEAVVTIIEALALQQLVKSQGSMVTHAPLSFPKALAVSLVANAASLGAGFLLLSEPSEKMAAILSLISIA